MRSNKRKTQFGLIVILSLSFLTGCTKDKNINTDGVQTVDKDGFAASSIEKKELTGCEPNALVTSDSCPTQKEYLLVRSIEEANGNNTFDAIPGLQFNYGSVKIRIHKDHLDVLPSTDLQFSYWGYFNLKEELVVAEEPVVSFPIVKHFDKGRVKNEYGEETNIEAELEEGSWAARKYIRVDWAKPTTKAFRLPNNFWDENYLQEDDVHLVSEVQRDSDGNILFDTESLLTTIFGTQSYTIRTKTSLIQLNPSDFKARKYSDEEFDKFGIFRSFRYRLGMQSGLNDKDIEKFASVYNLCPNNSQNKGKSCATNKIEFYLSRGMPYEYQEMSKLAVLSWNKLFQSALDRQDDILILKEEQVAVSETRKNVIAYVDTNFVDGGLLGVSQSVSSPVNGETISSRSTVFGDGIESLKGRIDLILDMLIANPYAITDFLDSGLIPTAESTLSTNKLSSFNPDKDNSKKIKQIDFNKNIESLHRELATNSILKSSPSGSYISNTSKLLNPSVSSFKSTVLSIGAQGSQDPNFSSEFEGLYGLERALSEQQRADLPSEMLGFKDMMLGSKYGRSSGGGPLGKDSTGALSLLEKRELLFGRQGIHGHDLVEDSLMNYLKKQIIESLKIGLGDGLSDIDVIADLKEKIAKGEESAIIKLLELDLAAGSPIRSAIKQEAGKKIFFTTLLHEMGHSFGLRHNFIASVDKANFHPNYHAIEERIKNGDPELSRLDLEEWAFSSVMDYNASFQSDLMELGPYDEAAIQYAYNPSKKITKKYLFCTDEGVADDVLCNRQDQGVNLAEITLNRIKSYHNRYVTSFFRLGRTFFGSRISNLASQYMLPIRSVIDESLYQLAFGKPAGESLSSETGCSDLASATSVKNQEFAVNICNRSAFENYLSAVGSKKTVLDLDAYEEAINLTKPLHEFLPMSRADLALSSLLAKSFFTGVMGSPEPGVYLLERLESGKQLTKIPGVGPSSSSGGDLDTWQKSVSEGLYQLAMERRLNPNRFIEDSIKDLVDINLGKGKYFKTKLDLAASNYKLSHIGSLIEKYYAILVMSTRYLPVPKYSAANFQGNMYLWPNSREFTKDLFSKLIQKSSHIANVEYYTRGNEETGAAPERGFAPIVATQDYNTQYIATSISLLSFITEQDKTYEKNLGISDDPQTCELARKQGNSYEDIQLSGEQICAFGDSDSKSFTVPMLQALVESQKNLKQYEDILANTADIVSQAKQKLTEIKTEDHPIRVKLNLGIQGFESLEAEFKLVTSQELIDQYIALSSRQLFSFIESRSALSEKLESFVTSLVFFAAQRADGGLSAFADRIQRLLKSSGKKLNRKFSGKLAINPNKIDMEKITDAQLTQLAQLYIDYAGEYMGYVENGAEMFFAVKAAPVLKDQTISQIDSQIAPIKELVSLKKMFK